MRFIDAIASCLACCPRVRRRGEFALVLARGGAQRNFLMSQVVNSDVGELWDMRMRGQAAVAMTPFCQKDENKQTTGFRFFAQAGTSPSQRLAAKPFSNPKFVPSPSSAFRARPRLSALAHPPSGVVNSHFQAHSNPDPHPNP